MPTRTEPGRSGLDAEHGPDGSRPLLRSRYGDSCPGLLAGLLCGVAAIFAVVSLAAPLASLTGWTRVAGWLYTVMSYFCHQMPSRSLWLLGASSGMCTRSLFLCGTFAAVGLLMIRCRVVLSWQKSAVLLIPIFLDTLTQSAGWRESTNVLRILTGTLGGVGVAGLVVRRSIGMSTARPLAGATLARGAGGLLILGILALGAPDILVRAETGSTFPDRTACEELAAASAEDAGRKTVGSGGGAGLGAAHPGACLVMPFFAIGQGVGVAWENRKTQRMSRDLAMKECLEPSLLADRLGPENPQVAQSLRGLANSYAILGLALRRRASETERSLAGDSIARRRELEARSLAFWKRAEALYVRALEIQERALGPEQPDSADTLEDYAQLLLRPMGRATEADALQGRAKAIRAKRGEQPSTN